MKLQSLLPTMIATIFSKPASSFLTRSFSRSAAGSTNTIMSQIQATTTTTRRFASTTATTIEDEKVMQDLLFRIRKVNQISPDIKASLLNFVVDGKIVGKVRPKIADLLCSADRNKPVFCLDSDSADGGAIISTSPVLTLTPDVGISVKSRTEAVNRIMSILRDQGIVSGWRDEDYPVKPSFYEETLFGVERASASLLGIMEYGVHINGLVQGNDGQPRMWIARRAADKSKYPGMLDHIVAGGQPVGLSLLENVVKECQEEAGIPEDITLAGLSNAGAISYETYSEHNDCVTRCVLFNFDLHLPNNFIPKPVDGEVEEFFLWDIDQIKTSMAPNFHDPIKPNCYPVIIDYLLRCGHISPDTKGYLDVLKELRSGDCY